MNTGRSSKRTLRGQHRFVASTLKFFAVFAIAGLVVVVGVAIAGEPGYAILIATVLAFPFLAITFAFLFAAAAADRKSVLTLAVVGWVLLTFICGATWLFLVAMAGMPHGQVQTAIGGLEVVVSILAGVYVIVSTLILRRCVLGPPQKTELRSRQTLL